MELMVCSNSFDIHFDFEVNLESIYVYKSLFDSNDFNSNVSPANIVFMNNYSNDVNGGYYRLDNIEEGETIAEPPIPTRDGYEFTGWYTETECITAWNFETSPTIEEGAEFRLYAGWREV